MPIVTLEFVKTKEAVVHFFDVKNHYTFKAKIADGLRH